MSSSDFKRLMMMAALAAAAESGGAGDGAEKKCKAATPEARRELIAKELKKRGIGPETKRKPSRRTERKRREVEYDLESWMPEALEKYYKGADEPGIKARDAAEAGVVAEVLQNHGFTTSTTDDSDDEGVKCVKITNCEQWVAENVVEGIDE